ncbi:MAG: hypothetical protein U5K77_00735 [Candidatus Saccharibacteria bacterium]|nr:hypothetical protein [Candidatus Saccharibacteria bacterium]
MGVPQKIRCEPFETCGKECPVEGASDISVRERAIDGVEFAVENDGNWPDMYPGPRDEEARDRAFSCMRTMCIAKTVAIGSYNQRK